jgi:hypothetical protein
MEYTFKNNIGLEVTVMADDEESARKAAMVALYHSEKPDEAWLGKEWLGHGLDLVAMR